MNKSVYFFQNYAFKKANFIKIKGYFSKMFTDVTGRDLEIEIKRDRDLTVLVHIVVTAEVRPGLIQEVANPFLPHRLGRVSIMSHYLLFPGHIRRMLEHRIARTQVGAPLPFVKLSKE